MNKEPSRDDPGPPGGEGSGTSRRGGVDSGGRGDGQGKTFAEKLKEGINREERLTRNVLEINLEDDYGARINVGKDTIAKLFNTIGIRIGSDIEAYQVGIKKIFVWLKSETDVMRFCKDESIRVTNTVRTSLIKPMDKKEVAVTIRGINLNTSDRVVIDYLNHHGKVKSEKVIYDVDKEGPFKGIRNGDRKYLCDFSNGRNMGSFHLIDGSKVTVTYAGQRRTCGRCHETSRNCPGGGLGKICYEKKRPKIDILDHMKAHWDVIGYKPSDFKLSEDIEDPIEIPVIKENDKFLSLIHI